jgi:SAM-dependent methyltransferase
MSVWGRVFAALYDRMLAESEANGLTAMRAGLLAQAQGRTLEIGAGTGLNLAHYPAAVTELTLSEPEAPMAARLQRRVAAATGAATPSSGRVRSARVVRAPAETLPFGDGAFDTVVATLVLCTVADPARTLAEIDRVLAPGGRLLFLEHVRSADPVRARWQDRLVPLWRRLGHGCVCNRRTEALIAGSPLEIERVEETRIPKAAPIVRPAIVGSAVATS